MSSIAPPAHTRSKLTSNDWITPKWLIDQMPQFDLDPCASKTQPWPCAKESYTVNGLILPWHGLVWCNPPYGKQAAPWLNRMALYNDGIALVFARTETQMFFDHIWPFASLLLFLEGRLTFHYPDGRKPKEGHNSGGPSVLIGYGVRAARALMEREELGTLVLPFRKRLANPAGGEGNPKEWSVTVRGFNTDLRDKTVAAIRAVVGENNGDLYT